MEPAITKRAIYWTSPLHASTVGMILNLQTGHVSLQYHIVHDDFFTMVYAGGAGKPQEWAKLFTMNQTKHDFDNDKYEPQLNNEWLTPEEQQEKGQQHI